MGRGSLRPGEDCSCSQKPTWATSSAPSPGRGSPRVSRANTSDQEGKGEALAEPWRQPRTGRAMAGEEARRPAQHQRELWDDKPAVDRQMQPLGQVLSPHLASGLAGRPCRPTGLHWPRMSLPQPHPPASPGHYPHLPPAPPSTAPSVATPQPSQTWGHMLPATLSSPLFRAFP